MTACAMCGDGDDDTHLVACANCGALVCPECSTWDCAENDESRGDWFCKNCIQAAEAESAKEER